MERLLDNPGDVRPIHAKPTTAGAWAWPVCKGFETGLGVTDRLESP